MVVEPLYNKVKDFALEFYADEDGSVRYEGLSLFHTEGATFRGNVIASEKEKRRQLSAFIPWEEVLPLIDHFRKVMSPAVRNIYTGPFGIDLMVVDEEGHYYVKVAEMNLRKTMGWAAIIKDRTDKTPSISADEIQLFISIIIMVSIDEIPSVLTPSKFAIFQATEQLPANTRLSDVFVYY